MIVLADVRSLGKNPSGIGMYMYNFITGLMQDADIQFELLTDVVKSAELEKLEKADIPIHKYGNNIQKSVGVYAYFRFVQKKIYEIKPEIFWEGNNLIPIKLKNPFGKIMVTIHDIFPVSYPECFGKIYPWYFKYSLKKTMRNVDMVVYNSKETQKNVECYEPKACELKNLISYIVVDNLPDQKAADKNFFLYIGNMEKRKGTDLLLKAYCIYRKNGGEKQLYLGGKIREKEIEELLAVSQQEVSGICYLGYVDTDEKYRLYASCSAFVFPSRAEGFGIPVIEALYYHKPVIASNLGIFREIAGDQLTYFDMYCNRDRPEELLAKRMECYENVDEDKADKVVAKYKQAALCRKLKEFLFC